MKHYWNEITMAFLYMKSVEVHTSATAYKVDVTSQFYKQCVQETQKK